MRINFNSHLKVERIFYICFSLMSCRHTGSKANRKELLFSLFLGVTALLIHSFTQSFSHSINIY